MVGVVDRKVLPVVLEIQVLMEILDLLTQDFQEMQEILEVHLQLLD
jgi:hypothetical protein